LRAGKIAGLQGLSERLESLSNLTVLLAASAATVMVMVMMDLAAALLLLGRLLEVGKVLLRGGKIAVLQILRQGIEGVGDGVAVIGLCLRLRLRTGKFCDRVAKSCCACVKLPACKSFPNC